MLGTLDNEIVKTERERERRTEIKRERGKQRHRVKQYLKLSSFEINKISYMVSLKNNLANIFDLIYKSFIIKTVYVFIK